MPKMAPNQMLVGTPSYALCSPCLSKAAQSPRVAPVPLASQDTCQVLLANGKEEIIPLPPPPRPPRPRKEPGLRTANWWNCPGALHRMCAQSFPGAAWEKEQWGQGLPHFLVSAGVRPRPGRKQTGGSCWRVNWDAWRRGPPSSSEDFKLSSPRVLGRTEVLGLDR